MSSAFEVRPYADSDAAQVRALFIAVNRSLAPPHMEAAFEAYIARSLEEEIDCIPEYYGARDGSFWVAEADGRLVGVFGLEAVAADTMELRRMYVAPQARRQGIARRLLTYAEDHCRAGGVKVLHLSTSELQPAALAFYRAAGYRLSREEVAEVESNKTIGGGIRRYYFDKHLDN